MRFTSLSAQRRLATGPSALLFYSGAADEIASLAPNRALLSRNDRKALAKASESLFTINDPRHRRVLTLLNAANQRSFKERLTDVAETCGVRLTQRTSGVVDELYEMRNHLAHAGRRPPNNIFYLFTTGLSVLDQLISALLRKSTGGETP